MTIDDFHVGPITLSKETSAAVSELQTGLDTAHVLGGARDILVNGLSPPGQTFIIDTALRELRFFAGPSRGYLDVRYGTNQPLDVDLTADGSNSFLITFADTTLTDVRPLARVVVTTGSGAEGRSLFEPSAITTPLPNGGIAVKLPFSTFGSQVDFESVQEITLDFGRVLQGSQLTITHFATVPEAASLVLLSLGAIGVAAIASRRGRGTAQFASSGSARKGGLVRDRPVA